MELATKYDPKEVESKWYQYWLDNKLFSSKPDGREPYTVVIPPPNVTGVLHMGHMLNNTIQDILVRRARMEGKNACWVPGTDHASIATEAKVVKKLAEQGIKKSDLTREKFLKHAWDWTHEHGGIILKQLRKLGASCDWDRTAFTMDEKRSKSVIHVFVDLYNKGLIYRGLRMVNWDPKALTALSTEEVIYREEQSHLFHLKYYVDGLDSLDNEQQLIDEGNIIHHDERGYYAVVATTRPETIMGDTAMCINPKDPKNQWLKGRKVIVPLVGRVIPVIEDRYVDIEFGTGCLKVTPAHDTNDYMLGKTHNLETIDIFNADGTITPPEVKYDGYAFLGWATSPTGEVEYQDTIPATAVAALDGKTLYARWQKSITLTYNSGDGTGDEQTEEVASGTEITLKKVQELSFTAPEHKVFDKWQVQGSSTTYADGAKIPAPGLSADTKLIAQWKDDLINITYNGNGSTSGSTAAQTAILRRQIPFSRL